MIKKYQVSRFVLDGHPYMISSHFMPSTGWRLGTVVPESVILASVAETRNALDSTVKSMATRFTLVTTLFLIVSIIVIAILTIKSFIRPLDKLSKAALRVKGGDLTTHVDIDAKDEIGWYFCNFMVFLLIVVFSATWATERPLHHPFNFPQLLFQSFGRHREGSL